jgi:hypothetical protein
MAWFSAGNRRLCTVKDIYPENSSQRTVFLKNSDGIITPNTAFLSP